MRTLLTREKFWILKMILTASMRRDCICFVKTYLEILIALSKYTIHFLNAISQNLEGGYVTLGRSDILYGGVQQSEKIYRPNPWNKERKTLWFGS